MKVNRHIPKLIVAAAALLCLPATASAVSVSSAERAVVAQINDYRAARGLPTLRVDATLTRTAEWMSADMAARNRFSHVDSLGRDPFRRLAAMGYPSRTYRGENLAAGNAAPAPTFRQWRTSPGHNANMVNSRYRAIGVARVHDATSPYGYYWTTTFGSTVTRVV